MPRTPNLFFLGLIGAGTLSCATPVAWRGVGLPSPFSRIDVLTRILVLEDSRSLGGDSLAAFLQSDDPSIRRRAVLAAGRIGDPAVVPRLIQRLKDPEAEVRRIAAFSLGLLAKGEAEAPLAAALTDPDPATRGRAAEALSRLGRGSPGPLIAAAFRRALPASAGALRIRGDDPGRADDPWIEIRLYLAALARLKDAAALSGALLGSDGQPVVDWWAAVWAAAQVSDSRLAPVFLSAARAEDGYVRSLAARGLGELKDRQYLDSLKLLAADHDLRVSVQALRALGRMDSLEAAAAVAGFLEAKDLVLRHEALLSLAALPQDPRWRAKVIENVGHQDSWIRAAAWPALARLDGTDVGFVLSTIGPDPDWRVRQAVALALADGLGPAAAPLLRPMLSDEDPHVRMSVLLALARASGQGALPALLSHVQDQDAGIRSAAVEGLSLLEAGNEERFIDALARALEAAAGDLESRMLVVETLARSTGEEARGLLRGVAATDPSRVLRRRAAAALGEAPVAPDGLALRTPEARRLVSIYETGGPTLFSPRALISTRHGKFELGFDLVDTPLTSMSFVRLAQSGFFNGLTFHRVIPGLLVQGGDPRGDGYGGPGRTIGSELSVRPFGRGTVGMAVSGQDAAGSQFFVALEPQPQLDGLYTPFAQVLSGMAVVDQLRPGDVIERIEIFDGREAR